MKISSNGLQLIEQFEGLILQAYDDFNDHIVKEGEEVRGTLTIGYGHTSAAGSPEVTVGQKITKDQANTILANDLTAVENSVTSLVKVTLNQNEFDALVSFQFNTGALGRSTLLRKLNAGDRQGASDEFLRWNRGNGQVLGGLVKRRQAERALFLKPVTQTTKPATPKTNVAVGTTVATGAVVASQHWHIHWGWVAVAALSIFIVYELIKHLKGQNVTKS